MNEISSASPVPHGFNVRAPWLGVHVLTEFVFCPRAGLVELEKESLDEGDEAQREPWANLSYVPLYDVREIDERIERERRRMTWLVFASVVLVPLSVIAYRHFGIWWLFVALGAFLVVLKLFGSAVQLIELHWLRNQALSALGREPDPSVAANQEVVWWELLRAGFEPRPSPEGFSSESLQLTGRPWRVLVRGSTRIPVFKKRHCGGENGHRIYPQHVIRIAAYCRLIEEAEGAESPYGIVLFDDCYKGIAIKAFTAVAQATLRKAIADARGVIADSRDSKHPAPPAPELCSNCPVGRPRVHRQGKTETMRGGVPTPVFAAVGADRRWYHSACGDRFSWLPPHKRAAEKGLAATGGAASGQALASSAGET